ncbi:unnamed protein product [Agarophyton chilense]
MPARLRDAHAAQLKKQRPPDTPERPVGPRGAARCRKYRKKARFLKAIRRLRSKNPGWLETHIWHAKRFLMGDIAGRRVAVNCNDRGYRSAYKAAARASVIHDASYLDIIEICGDLLSLKKLLNAATGPHSNRVTTNPVVRGCRWVSDVVIMDGEKAVGPSDVLWRPSRTKVSGDENPETEERKAWLWVHPTLTDPVIQALRKYATDGTKVDTIVVPPQRFSLYGPRSGIVLASVLCNTSIPFIHVARARSANCLPAGCVVSSEAEDPRASFPPKRMAENAEKVGRDSDSSFGVDFQTVSDCELWNEKEREMWTELIASGKGKAVQDRIPFIILQRRMCVAAGYELLVPGGTGMIFWNSLMYANGARAIGTEEVKRLRMESLMEVFPEDYQDGETGYSLLQKERQKEEERYNRRPPAKRVNYTLNRITSPMMADLEGVSVNESKLLEQKRKRMKLDKEAEGQREVRIVRERNALQQLLGKQVYEQLRRTKEGRGASMHSAAAPHSEGQDGDADKEVRDEGCTQFVRVCIEPLSRGSPERNGIVCEPNAADVESIGRLGLKFAGEAETKWDGKRGEKSPTRDVIGYITVGGWGMRRGRPVGCGLVAVSALKRLAASGCGQKTGRKGAYVVFRNTKSVQYRAALVTVLTAEW